MTSAVPAAVGPSIDRGVAWLLRKRKGDGTWLDFWTPAGISDEWVTAFVGCMLAATANNDARAAARETWQLLECRRFHDDGWGYHAGVPADADTTQWALQLARAAGCPEGERQSRARSFLERHIVDGGLTTYHDAEPIRAFLGLPQSVAFDGWRAAHLCVTAAAALLPERSAQLAVPLRAAQRADGSWSGYWWFDDEYTTALAAESLARQGDTAAIGAACRWAAARVEDFLGGRSGRSAFALAWLLRTIALAAETRPLIDPLSSAIERMQEDDGSWPAGAVLRIPPPFVRNPSTVESWERWFGLGAEGGTLEATLRSTFSIFSLDQSGVFTTAAVVGALAATRDVTARVTPPRRLIAATADDVSDFRRDGCVVLRGVLDPREIAALRPIVHEAMQAAAMAQEGRADADRLAFVRAENLWLHAGPIRSLVLSPRLGRLAASLLGVPRVRLFHDQVFFKLPGGSRTPWHQDSYYWPLDTSRILTIWIPLTPVTPCMGALRFVPGTHHAGSLGDLQPVNDDEQELARLLAAQEWSVRDLDTLERGDVSVHAGWMLHGAHPNRSAVVREALTIIYFEDGARVTGDERLDPAEPYQFHAVRTRRHDRARYLAGLRPGDRAVTELNPLVSQETWLWRQGSNLRPPD